MSVTAPTPSSAAQLPPFRVTWEKLLTLRFHHRVPPAAAATCVRQRGLSRRTRARC